MAEVALTDIQYGSEGRLNADGTVTQVKVAKTVKAGDSIPSGAFTKEQLQELRDNGAVGDDGRFNAPALGSTASQLQAEGSPSLTNTPPNAATPATPPTEEELATALREATDQVSRAEGSTSTADEGEYADWSNDDLAAELESRGLTKSGNKSEMIARLQENDAA